MAISITQSPFIEDNLYQGEREAVEWQSIHNIRGNLYSPGLSTMTAQKAETEK